MSAEITVEQWLKAMEDAGISRPDDPGKTVVEIAEELGITNRTCARRIGEAVKNGTMKCGYAVRADAAGRRQRVPVYSPVMMPRSDKSSKHRGRS